MSTVSMNSTRLIYLHGFNSSPESYKAKQLYAYMEQCNRLDQLIIPEIPPVPFEAMAMLVALYEQNRQQGDVAVAGSSLGGFYATCLAERFGCRAVLINPAVRPQQLLKKYLGENINYYTSECWMLNETHIEQFRELDSIPVTRPERYLLMLQKGDETLDYRDALEKYQGCPLLLEEGGDHSFTGFANHIEQILNFCGITA
ncbi:MAG: esterase YqiA [Gammaproteobacteria bacterium]|nr:esterase YqiA [Gammaproteobacteria bacterium]